MPARPTVAITTRHTDSYNIIHYNSKSNKVQNFFRLVKTALAPLVLCFRTDRHMRCFRRSLQRQLTLTPMNAEYHIPTESLVFHRMRYIHIS